MAFFASLAARLADYRRSRRIVRDLAALDDYLPRDIGLSRIDVRIG
ncbi:DUF1127 domain-containing protein [Rhizobium sp.]